MNRVGILTAISNIPNLATLDLVSRTNSPCYNLSVEWKVNFNIYEHKRAVISLYLGISRYLTTGLV